jgi:hypothetical protein
LPELRIRAVNVECAGHADALTSAAWPPHSIWLYAGWPALGLDLDAEQDAVSQTKPALRVNGGDVKARELFGELNRQ